MLLQVFVSVPPLEKTTVFETLGSSKTLRLLRRYTIHGRFGTLPQAGKTIRCSSLALGPFVSEDVVQLSSTIPGVREDLGVRLCVGEGLVHFPVCFVPNLLSFGVADDSRVRALLPWACCLIVRPTRDST